MDAPEVWSGRDPRVGSRVVVRHRLGAPDPLTGATLTDAVGELVSDDDGILVVRTRRGEVRAGLGERTDFVRMCAFVQFRGTRGSTA